jgi:hypothetical protein
MRVTRKDPPSEEVKKQMLASGKWRLTQSGKLVRVDGEGGLSVQDVFGVSGEPLDYSPENNYGDGPVEMKPEYMLGAALGGRAVMPLVDNAALAVSSALNPVGTALNTNIGGVTGLTANNLLGAYGASDFVVNRAPGVAVKVSEGDYSGAAADAAIGALDIMGARTATPALAKNVVTSVPNPYEAYLDYRLLPKTSEGSQYLKAEFAEKIGGLLGNRLSNLDRVLPQGLKDKVYGMDLNPALTRRFYDLQERTAKAQSDLVKNPDVQKFLADRRLPGEEAAIDNLIVNDFLKGDIVSNIDTFLSEKKYAMNATTKKALLKYRNSIDKIIKETIKSPLTKGVTETKFDEGTRTANRLGVYTERSAIPESSPLGPLPAERYDPSIVAAKSLLRREIVGGEYPYSLGDALSGGFGNVPRSPIGKVSVKTGAHQLGNPLEFDYMRPYKISPSTKEAFERGYTGRTPEQVAQELQQNSKNLFSRDNTKPTTTTNKGEEAASLKLNKSFANSEEMLKKDPITISAQGSAPYVDIIEGGISKRAQVALSHHAEFENMGAGHIGKGADGIIDTPRSKDFIELNKLIKKSEYPTTKKEVTVYRNQGTHDYTPVYVNRAGSKTAVKDVGNYEKGDLINGLSQARGKHHAEAYEAYNATEGASPVYRPTSTSLSPMLETSGLPGSSGEGRKIKIIVPEGTPAANTSNIHGSAFYEKEMELILHPEQKYVVESVDGSFTTMRAITDAEYDKLLKAQGGSKAQGGVITMRKKRNGMSPIRK